MLFKALLVCVLRNLIDLVAHAVDALYRSALHGNIAFRGVLVVLHDRRVAVMTCTIVANILDLVFSILSDPLVHSEVVLLKHPGVLLADGLGLFLYLFVEKLLVLSIEKEIRGCCTSNETYREAQDRLGISGHLCSFQMGRCKYEDSRGCPARTPPTQARSTRHALK